MNRIFLLVFFLLAGFAQGGANVIVPEGDSKYALEILTEDNCNLPAPTNLELSNITTTTMDADWDAVPGAVGYLVEAYEDSNNALLFSATETGTSKTITGLPPGTLIRVEVSAICPGGGVSANKAERNGTTEIIIEVVMGGYQCPSSELLVTLNGLVGNEISFALYNDEVYYGVLRQSDSYQNEYSNDFFFTIQLSGQEYNAKIYPDNENNSFPIGNLRCASIQQSYCTTTDYAQIVNDQDDQFCKITFSIGLNSQAAINLEFINPYVNDQYFFDIYKCDLKSRNSEMKGEIVYKSKQLVLSPNPAYDYLRIDLKNFEQETIEPMNVQILDIAGNIVVDEKNILYNESFILDISSISKSGIYLIKMANSNMAVNKKVTIFRK